MAESAKIAMEASMNSFNSVDKVVSLVSSKITNSLQASLTGATLGFIDMAVAGKASGESVEKAFSDFLKGFSKQMAVLALGEAAKSIASFATLDVPGGIAHAAAAGAFTTAAVAAGVGAAAIAPPPKGRHKTGVSRGLGGAASNLGEDRGGSQTFSFNINTVLSPSNEEEYARLIGNGMRLAQNRGFA